jgi:hypothetical protein
MYKLLIILILFSTTILSTIEVSGTQFGEWTSENNPYNVTGDITVPEGEVLMIYPGVEVVIDGDFRITAEGNIMAMGTEADSIYFHSTSDGIIWGGIRLESETQWSRFEYCKIENGEDGINSINSEVTIAFCRFYDNEQAVHIYGIGNPTEVFVLNSYIANCQQNGIYIVENSNAQIRNNEITQCALDNSPRGAIMLSSQGGDCSPLIVGNYIHHNAWQGISAWDVTGGSNINATIFGNGISYNLTGIYLYYASGIVDSNYIHNNFIAGNANSGAGIMISGASSVPIIRRNEITGNFTGFYITENANPNLGDMINDYPGDDGENYIHDNIDESGNTWSVYNASGNEILAQNNIWDSELNAEIDETIMGSVNYEPIVEMVFNPATDIEYEMTDDQLHMTWSEPEFGSGLPFSHYQTYLDGTMVGQTTDTEYTFSGLENGNPYTIGLISVYLHGFESECTDMEILFVDANDEELQIVNHGLQNYPNPFNPTTTISFSLTTELTESTENTELIIYNIKGHKVKTFSTICHPELVEGSIVWDGNDENGKPVSSGIYFAKLVVDSKASASQKMILLK